MQTENQVTVLPAEVEQIAQNVSVEKRSEVQTVLNQIFNGVSKMRDQLDSIVVADENDKVNMKLANTIRLGVRQTRLDAEKIFDAKRAEVQQQMLSYKTEDALWLKAKQTMQILTKEIEENARIKEETRQRFEAEQKELKIQQRMVQVSKVAPEMPRSEFENMSDDSFAIFLAGIEKQYNDRIEAEKKAEAERLEAIEAERKRQEEIRLENERLKKEAEEKEKALAIEREKAEAERKKQEAILLAERKAAEQKAAKERAEAEAKLKAEQEKARKEMEAKEAERKKLEAELEAKRKAEQAEKDRIEAEAKAKAVAEAKLAKAGDKKRLLAFVDQFSFGEIDITNMKPESKSVYAEVMQKYDGFIAWSKNQINSL